MSKSDSARFIVIFLRYIIQSRAVFLRPLKFALDILLYNRVLRIITPHYDRYRQTAHVLALRVPSITRNGAILPRRALPSIVILGNV